MEVKAHLKLPTRPLTEDELPTKPLPTIKKILVTGAAGYIGGRLIPVLLARGYKLRILVRKAVPEYQELWPSVEIVVGSTFDLDVLAKAFIGIDVAYYLVHSLLIKPGEFVEEEIKSAQNFRVLAEKNKVKRIIYLGGLGDINNKLSEHLYSRIEVDKELRKGSVPITTLRAAIIIGSGGASFELIQNVVEFLPFIPCTPFCSTKCQPICIRDVRKYLVGVLEVPETSGKTFDIGGPEVLTYRQMLEIIAVVLKKNRRCIRLPIQSTRVISYVLSFISTVPAPIILNLMDGLKNDVICLENSIDQYVKIEKIKYKDSIERAVYIEKRQEVITRWSDSYDPSRKVHIKLNDLGKKPTFVVSYHIDSNKTADSLFESVCQIGGKKGWCHNNWMWRLRGLADRILLGVGTARGRRSDRTLKTNDVLDFWRVEKIVKNRELLLYAEMKLPGLAWLKFEVKDGKVNRQLSVTAYFETAEDRLGGALYWYFFLPFHHFIFEGLLKHLEKRSVC